MSDDDVEDAEMEIIEDKSNGGMVEPVMSIDEAKEQFQEYQNLRTELADENDIVTISGKEHPTKSFVRKVQKFFNISCEITGQERIENNGDFTWLITARAIHHASGTTQESTGACSGSEKRENNMPDTEHNVRSHAETRAKNRAVLDLAGFGEVSAEEIKQQSNKTAQKTEVNLDNNEIEWPFGDMKGTPLNEVDEDNLEWLIDDYFDNGNSEKLDKGHDYYQNNKQLYERAVELIEDNESEEKEPKEYVHDLLQESDEMDEEAMMEYCINTVMDYEDKKEGWRAVYSYLNDVIRGKQDLEITEDDKLKLTIF